MYKTAIIYTKIGCDTYNNDCDEYFIMSRNLSNSDILIFKKTLVIPPNMRKEILRKIRSEEHSNLTFRRVKLDFEMEKKSKQPGLTPFIAEYG